MAWARGEGETEARSEVTSNLQECFARGMVTEPGRLVVIHSLGSRPELNEQLGTVIRFDTAAGRACVQLKDDNLQLMLRPECLRLATWHAGVPENIADDVYGMILTSYKIRIDDAYAAIGIMRGAFRLMYADYDSCVWGKPEADLRRYLAAGAERGALPPWWSEAHTEKLLHSTSMLNNPLYVRDCSEVDKRAGAAAAAEEPVDLIRAAGSEAEEFVRRMREMGDEFEGAPSWGAAVKARGGGDEADRGGPRDRTDGRPTLRKQNDQVCERCRGAVTELTARGCGPCEYDCSWCSFQGKCPKCTNGDIEQGRCTSCDFVPTLYLLVDSMRDEFATRGCRLAAQLKPPQLHWYVTDLNTPQVCYAAAAAERREKDREAWHEGSHLEESRDPELLILREAALMWAMGCAIIERALGLAGTNELDALQAGLKAVKVGSAQMQQAMDSHLNACAARADLEELKAGMQLCADAFMTSQKCVVGGAKDGQLGLFLGAAFDVVRRSAVTGNSELMTFKDGFALTMNMFEFAMISLHRGAEEMSGIARQSLDKVSTGLDFEKACSSQVVRVRLRARRLQAQLLLLRSHDKLTRLNDSKGAYADLDLAIEKARDAASGIISSSVSLCDLRVPRLLRLGRLHEARLDLEQACREQHNDHRAVHENLYTIAAIYVRSGNLEAGRPYYERARVAEARFGHLFGVPPSGTVQKSERNLRFFASIAHAAYAVEAQRLRVQPFALSGGLPRSEAQAFLDGLFLATRGEDAAAPGSFEVDDKVLVRGLQSEAARHHNGTIGYVEGPLIQGRHAVELSDGVTIKVKPANLRPLQGEAVSIAFPALDVCCATCGTTIQRGRRHGYCPGCWNTRYCGAEWCVTRLLISLAFSKLLPAPTIDTMILRAVKR